MKELNAKEKITLVGAGPVGSLLALFLAKKNFEVEIFERRTDMRIGKVDGGRSINLAVSTRGLHALSEVGLKAQVLKMAIPMLGRMVHSVDGKTTFLRYGKNDSQYINSVSRGGLNKLLMTEAEKTGSVKINFNHRVLDCDLSKNNLEIQSEDKRTQHKFKQIIGTDGSASIIRKKISDDVKENTLNYGYKELHIPPGSQGNFQMEKNALHIWPRGTYMLIALPNEDGSFTATLFLPFEGNTSFASLKNPGDVEEFFRRDFKDVLELMPEIKEDFFKNPTGHMVTVKCSPWNFKGSGLILGDAAHAMVPFFGQGMNCGFEDCADLMELLKSPIRNSTNNSKDQTPEDGWTETFSKFSDTRKNNTDAISDMAVENFIEMRDKVADSRFLLEKGVEKILQEKFPLSYVPRYQLVTFSRLPYRMAYDAGLIENEILAELCQTITDPFEVDIKRAEVLINQKLKPFFDSKQNHFIV